MLPDDLIVLPIHQVVPTLRNQISADLGSVAEAVQNEEWDRAMQLLTSVRNGIGLLEACLEDIKQSESRNG